MGEGIALTGYRRVLRLVGEKVPSTWNECFGSDTPDPGVSPDREDGRLLLLF